MASSQLRRYSPSRFVATGSVALRVLLATCAAGLAPAFACAQADPAPTTLQRATPEASGVAVANIALDAASLVEQLDADGYDDRERAMTKLAEKGDAAIDPLVARLPGASREMITRGLYVLARLALSDDEAIAERSREAIEEFATNPNSPLGRQAEIALDDLDGKMLAQTVARLRELGATVEMEVTSSAGLLQESVRLVALEENWQGTEQDLQLVGRLGQASEVRFVGERFGDEAVEIAAGLDDLLMLTVKKGKISPAGVAKLQQAESLETLRLLYCGGDDAIDAIGKIKSLSSLHLYGTKLSEQGEQRLKTMFADRQGALDIRRGGFLGVRGASIQEGALITDVVDGSAASQAGLRPGDIIVGIDDQPVADFEQVLKQIGSFLPSHEIRFAVQRGGERFERKVALGEWD